MDDENDPTRGFEYSDKVGLDEGQWVIVAFTLAPLAMAIVAIVLKLMGATL